VTADDIASLLRSIGAEKVRVVSHNKVSCACPLARWTHTKGSDHHPSFVVFTEGKHGDPIYACQACHDEGSVRDLLLFLWSKNMEVFHWIEVLDAGKALRREDVVEATKISERKFIALAKAETEGIRTAAGGDAPPLPPLPLTKRALDDGTPWFDYKCLAEADAVPEIPWSEYEPYAGKVPAYALDRGLTMETCTAWELGDDSESKRLLFPIRDRRGRLVTISGRLYATACLRCGGAWAVSCELCGEPDAAHVEGSKCVTFRATKSACVRCGTGEPPKYFHRKGFQRNMLLYGEHRSDDTDGRVYVVEGHLDMLRLWQAGYRPVVAVLGTGVGEAQVEKLVARWRRAIVVPDGDKSGLDMGERIKRMVAGRIKVVVKDLPDGADPGGMTDAELHELLDEDLVAPELRPY
jgi:hypothetical protein